ncbi:MAG: metallophosphoesterase family protein [Isosphaeraceae bacterium]
MLAAVLSDIHSNVFALQAVLRDAELSDVSEFWVCGDIFGYYPWASDCFLLLRRKQPVAVLGNHDSWLVDSPSAPAQIAGDIARHNARELASHSPAALDWLAALPSTLMFERCGRHITMAHGTPDDPLEGRYYPDDTRDYHWLPREGEILVLGQTHYPLLRGDARSGLLLNPGSVGQPRDRNPMPSWALIDLATGSVTLRRSAYDNIAVMARLRAMDWDERIVRSLDKR